MQQNNLGNLDSALEVVEIHIYEVYWYKYIILTAMCLSSQCTKYTQQNKSRNTIQTFIQ